jgi:5-methyltetrahydropteroyltriglutamate--homocysteine methyltransferase
VTDLRRTEPPFRADHVGSLLRPAKLAETRETWRKGEVSDAGLKAVEDDAIKDAVALQESAGLKAITDGEFRRDYWHLDFMTGFDGVRLTTETYGQAFSSGSTVGTCFVESKFKYPDGGIMREHFTSLKSMVHETAKFCIPSPTMFHYRAGRNGFSTEIYPDLAEFWADAAAAYRAAVADFHSLGCTYLQIDDVNFCYLCDAEHVRKLKERGDDDREMLDTYIAAVNGCTRGRPADMKITTHMCRGNFKSEWMAEGGYEPVAEKMLNEVDVDGFFMEFDSDRAGDFAPLRFLPKGKFVVLGLVSSKLAELESAEALTARIGEAAKVVPLEQLCLSPQCGFASTHHGNKLTVDDEKRKLARIVEVADTVWGSV